MDTKYGTGGASSSIIISGLDTNDSTYVIKSTEKANGCWLASPMADSYAFLPGVWNDGRIGTLHYEGITKWSNLGCNAGLRPLVCLETGVGLINNGDGTYSLTK